MITGLILGYIVIDGDDVGRMIAACYFDNNIMRLSEVNIIIEMKINEIAEMLRREGFTILFCAADGVAAAHAHLAELNIHEIYCRTAEIGGLEITFSAGVGENIREAYVALLTAKSNGKAQMVNFRDMQ